MISRKKSTGHRSLVVAKRRCIYGLVSLAWLLVTRLQRLVTTAIPFHHSARQETQCVQDQQSLEKCAEA
jgi:hypothetical protein